MEEKTKEINRKKLKGKECLLIRDDKSGTEVQLVSSSKSMDALIQSAFVIKLNFLDKSNEKVPEYIQ